MKFLKDIYYSLIALYYLINVWSPYHDECKRKLLEEINKNEK